MLTTKASVSSSRCRTTADPINPAPPVIKIAEPRRSMSPLSHERPVHRQQILAIATLRGFLSKSMKLIKRDIAEAHRNFFRTRNPHALTLLEDLHKMACFDQRGVGAGVEPSIASP